MRKKTLLNLIGVSLSLLISFLVLLSLISCDDGASREGTVHIIGVALDYHGSGQELYSCPVDLWALTSALYKTFDSSTLTYFVESGGKWYRGGYNKKDDPVWRLERNGGPKWNAGYRFFYPSMREVEGKDEDIKGMILSAISSLDAGPEDLVIFFYSGHGAEDGSLCISEDALLDHALIILPDELIDALSSLLSPSLVMLDSCYSGRVTNRSGNTLNITDTFVLDDKLYPIYDGSGKIYSYEAGDRFMGENALASFSKGTSVFSLSKTPIDDVYVLSASNLNQLSAGYTPHPSLPFPLWLGAFTMVVTDYFGFDWDNIKATGRKERATLYNLFNYVRDSFGESKKISSQTPDATRRALDLVLKY